MQNSKKKKLIVANSILIFLLITGTVFAWFAVNYNNEVDYNEVTVRSDSALELSIDGGQTWHNIINLQDYDGFKDVTYIDITGTGDGNFKRPALDQFPDYAVVSDTGEMSEPGENDYAHFTLMMRSKDTLDVYLGDGSKVIPSVGMDSNALWGTSAQNKSSYGNFSKDIVSGAIRISSVDAGGERIFTWIPRPEFFVDTTQKIYGEENVFIDKTDGESYKHYYLNSEKQKTELTSKVIKGDINAGKQQVLCSLTSKTGDYYTNQVDFYIWLEGTDNEARRAFVDGKFNVNLNIMSADAA